MLSALGEWFYLLVNFARLRTYFGLIALFIFIFTCECSSCFRWILTCRTPVMARRLDGTSFCGISFGYHLSFPVLLELFQQWRSAYRPRTSRVKTSTPLPASSWRPVAQTSARIPHSHRLPVRDTVNYAVSNGAFCSTQTYDGRSLVSYSLKLNHCYTTVYASHVMSPQTNTVSTWSIHTYAIKDIT